MGCVSSKHIKKDLKKGLLSNNNGDFNFHHHPQPPPSTHQKISPPRKSHQGLPEIINTWELMEDLEDEQPPTSISSKKSPKLRKWFAEIDAKTPMKFLNQLGSSPKVSKRFFRQRKQESCRVKEIGFLYLESCRREACRDKELIS